MGRLEMENHRSDTVTLLITLYEAGLVLCVLYSLAVCFNNIIPESLATNPISLNLFSP